MSQERVQEVEGDRGAGVTPGTAPASGVSLPTRASLILSGSVVPVFSPSRLLGGSVQTRRADCGARPETERRTRVRCLRAALSERAEDGCSLRVEGDDLGKSSGRAWGNPTGTGWPVDG